MSLLKQLLWPQKNMEMTKANGILSEKPEEVILRKTNGLVQPKVRPMSRLLFSPASVP